MFRKKYQVDEEGVDYPLTFWAQVPIPAEQRGLISEFKEKVDANKERGMKGVFVSYGKPETPDYTEVRAAKTGVFSSWEMVVDGADRRQKLINLGKCVRINTVGLRAAEELAEAVTDVGTRLRRARTYFLNEDDIIDYTFDDPENLDCEEFAVCAPEDRDHMVIMASIPMPNSFYEMYDRLRDTVSAKEREAGSSFSIGNEHFGAVQVKFKGNGKWEALGAKQDSYRATFEDATQEEVINEIAFDLAAERLSEDVIYSHICGYPLKDENIVSIEAASQKFGSEDFNSAEFDNG